jgi:hypothetical protein
LAGFAVIKSGPPNPAGAEVCAALKISLADAASMLCMVLSRSPQTMLATTFTDGLVAIIGIGEPAGGRSPCVRPLRVLARIVSSATADDLNRALEHMAQGERESAA